MTTEATRADDLVVLAEGKYLRLVRRGRWEFVERVNICGIVVIVAVTDDGRLVLTEQHRTPVGRAVIELPAGLAGDLPGAEQEDLAEAARRELLEETGWAAAAMERMFEAPTSAGASSETVVFYRARGLQKVAAGGGDASEQITVHEVPLGEVHGFLRARDAAGKMIDPKVYAGLWLVGNP